MGGKRKIWLKASYIPSKENLEADALSRLINPDSEWELATEAFIEITEIFGSPEIDVLASKLNKKCVRYISRFPDPEAWQIDAFTVPWTDIFFYAFLPFNLIAKTLQKIRDKQTECIIVVPKWEKQPWYPLFIKLTTSEPLIFKPDRKLLISPCRKKTHPRAAYLYI